jgi:hypothetical protein
VAFAAHCGAALREIIIMHASTAPLVERFLYLCSFDQRLRSSIASLTIDTHSEGMIALIRAMPRQSPWLSYFMPEIVGFLCQLGNFRAIVIQTDNHCLPFEMSDLLATFPLAGHKELAHDRSHLLEVKAMRGSQNFEALASYATRDHHVFLISTDGRYVDARLQRGSPATITPEQMIGQPIADFIGSVGAAYLMEQLQAVYEQGGERELVYPVVHPNGESRTYQGTLIAVPGSETCILLSQRVKPSSARSRSLAAPP